tara:strand:- start:102 stop:254 length:153 start_codon:yes stop_codon:yes gene_type:complete
MVEFQNLRHHHLQMDKLKKKKHHLTLLLKIQLHLLFHLLQLLLDMSLLQV